MGVFCLNEVVLWLRFSYKGYLHTVLTVTQTKRLIDASLFSFPKKAIFGTIRH